MTTRRTTKSSPAQKSSDQTVTGKNPEKQLAAFMARFTPEVIALAEAALAKLRARFPNAIQMVYDNYNFLVVGFSPTERASEAVFSLALFARGVSLCFVQAAAKLPDPKKLLQGTGQQARHIRLASAEDLDRPPVKALLSQAVKRAKVPFNSTQRGSLIIKSVSARQRPRRPT
jgi:hypothetical protein